MFSVEIQDRQVLDTLNDLLRKSSDLSEPMADIARLFRNVTEDSFQDQADPWGNPWKDLEDSTKKKRRKGSRGDVLSILQDTGILAGSITSSSGRDWAQVGEGMEYAAIQHFGGQAGRGHRVTIPSRKSLPIDENGEMPPAVQVDVLDILSSFLNPR
jgi:phage virion morphogenesis protein